MAADDALTAVAAALCAVPLGRFTAERAARAKAAAEDGDRDLAARIGALPKPAVAAWVVDLLVREAPEDLQRVLDLGEDLRDAQEAGDRERLRSLGGVRRTLLAEAARTAGGLAEAAGQHASDAVLEAVQQTLQAALASPEAAAAVRTGRLVRSLDADGLDPVDLGSAVAGAPGEAGVHPGRRADGGERRRRTEQERRERLERARDRAGTASTAARDADAALEDRRHDVDDLQRRIDELRTRLDAAQAAVREAEGAAGRAHRDAEDAAADVERLADGDRPGSRTR